MAITLSPAQRRGFVFRASEAVLYSVWRLATSVRAAIITVLLLGLAAVLGVFLPQIPPGVRGQPALTAAWLELQHSRFGFLTPLLQRLGLFDVFHAWWFWGIVAWLAFAIVACTYNRLPGVWRQTFRPPKRVPDALYERAAVTVMSGTTPDGIARALQRRRFKVWREEEGSAIYLFADRFPWAQLGTFAIHLALIVFLIGALVTRFTGFSANLTIAEGSSAPVFPVANEHQILVHVSQAVGAFSQDGRPLDFRSDLVLYRNGDEAKRCTTTVNSPCSLDGYSFHQAGFFGFGGELVVRDRETGATVYREVLALDRQLPVPEITIRDASNATLFAGAVLQTDRVGGSWGGTLPLPDAGQTFWIALRSTASSWTLAIFNPSQGADGNGAFISLGGRAAVGAYTIDFDRVSAMPSVTSADIPFPGKNEAPDDSRGVVVALENAVFGTRVTPAGDERLEQGTNKPSLLHIAGLAPGTVRLAEGDRIELGPYEYEFAGPRNFSGINVRRDRGDTLIWVASTLFILGLVTTLWFPRRRAWLRFHRKELQVVTQGRERLDISSLRGDE